MAELNFNASEAPARQPRVSTPLPAGVYTAEITSADVKPLKSGRGTGLSLEYTIIDPEEHANRKVWQHINVKHDSAQAERVPVDADEHPPGPHGATAGSRTRTGRPASAGTTRR